VDPVTHTLPAEYYLLRHTCPWFLGKEIPLFL
jgi:hypothetical protein